MESERNTLESRDEFSSDVLSLPQLQLLLWSDSVHVGLFVHVWRKFKMFFFFFRSPAFCFLGMKVTVFSSRYCAGFHYSKEISFLVSVGIRDSIPLINHLWALNGAHLREKAAGLFAKDVQWNRDEEFACVSDCLSSF